MPSKSILEDLYNHRKYSQARIARELNISKGMVARLMMEYSIPKRSKSETAYLQHNKTFQIKSPSNKKLAILYGLGLGLYWGEGNKVDQYNVRLGNTDPDIILCFVRFLKEICGVHEKDIKYGLQVFNDSDPTKAKRYWLDILKCSDENFHKTISVISQQGKGTYLRRIILACCKSTLATKD